MRMTSFGSTKPGSASETVMIWYAGPTSSEIWEKSMRSETALEHGVGDWSRYADSAYAAAMQSTRKFVISEMDSSTFYVPCTAIADTIHEVRPPSPSQPSQRSSEFH